jgi:drug/metabolite transporter (DMT)-like permease
VLLLVVCAGVWGVAYVFIREGIVLGASPLLFAAVRYALSAAAFAAIAAFRHEAWPTPHGFAVSAAVGGVLVIGLYGGFLYWGEQYTAGGYASVFSTSAPILTVAFAYFLLPGERLGPRSLVGLAIGFVGVVLLVAPTLTGGPGGGWNGPAFIVAAFVTTALGSVLLRRYGGGRQGLWQIGGQFAVAAGLLGGAAVILPVPEALPLGEGVWAALAALVALSSVVGYFTYFALHHRVGPVRANLVTYLIPLVGVATGSGVFGEPITPWEVAGFLVVISGLTLIVRDSSKRLPRPPPATRTAEAGPP